jgi:hypothetical protein
VKADRAHRQREREACAERAYASRDVAPIPTTTLELRLVALVKVRVGLVEVDVRVHRREGLGRPLLVRALFACAKERLELDVVVRQREALG